MSSKSQRHKVSKSKQRKASLASTSPNKSRETRIPLQQRINPEYLREEAQLQKLIETREEKLHEPTKDDLEVLFFTDGLPETSSKTRSDGFESPTSFKSLQSDLQSTQPQFLDTIVQIEEETLFERVKEPFQGSDTSLLYYPKTEKTLGNNGEPTEEHPLEAQGIFVAPQSSISERNKNLLCNRLLEEGKFDMFNKKGDLIGLEDDFPKRTQLMKFECSKEFPIQFVNINEEELNHSKHLNDPNVLLIKIGKLRFNHHHLFSEEEFLSRSVENFYEEYMKDKRQGISAKLLQNIAFLKNSLADIKSDHEKSKSTLKEIQNLRNQYHLSEKAHNDRVRNVLEEYKALKQLRKTQQYNSTTLKLKISIDKNFSVDKSGKLENLLEEEIQERFDLETLEYQDAKRERKIRKKSLSPREPEVIPELPQKPNLDQIKSKLRKLFKDSHFDLEVNSVVDILKTETTKTETINDIPESKRKSLISGLKFQLKVYCNNNFVGLINSSSISEGFEVPFNSSISIQLTHRLPEQIRIDLVEQRSLKSNIRLAKIYIPVPRAQTGDVDNQMDFMSSKSFQSELGIGSGQFCIRKNHQQMIRGSLAVKLRWKDNSLNINPQIPRTSLRDSQIDPMDPDLELDIRNFGIENEEELEDQHEDQPKGFSFLEDEMDLCSLEELRNNPRNRILRERARNNIKYKDYKLVPFDERQLEEPSENPTKIIDETLGMDPIDLQRFNGKKYLLEVYSKISNYCKSLSEECEEDHLLMENMPTLASLFTKFFAFFSPNRPLKPRRRSSGGAHRISSRNVDVSKLQVSLNIVRAFGVPQRQTEAQISSRKSSNLSSPKDPGFRPINIRPFVTVSYKDTSIRTSTGDGSNPTWNEQMAIPLGLKHWSDLKGSIVIQLFDEYVDDILEDDRNRLTDIYQRISSRFISELRIPLADLYFSQRIEGTFEMTSPPLLGYTKSMLKTPQSQTGTSTAYNSFIPDLKGPVFISLMINLEPLFELEFFSTRHLECTESDQLQTITGLWMYDYAGEFPDRKIDLFATLLNGKRVCIMNLLGAINLPFPVSEDQEKMESLLRRYVSLIPTIETIDPCVELNGVWLVNEVMTTMRCSAKDLAVLLTNFYLAAGLEAWLMVGESDLRINSCFVLLREADGEFSVIDPVTGKKYRHTDIYCPMTHVHFLVNDKNIWGNVQLESKVFLAEFDVRDSGNWRSVFKKALDLPKGFVGDPSLPFQQSYDIRNVHAILEAKLMKKISQWRGHRKTTWNRIVKDNLRRILIEMERDAVEATETSETHLDKLNFLHNNYRISGCPLNMKYVNLSHAVERVKSLGIHLNTDPRVEFGLSVYVHPYPNHVISVWIFLMALLPK